MTWKFTAPLLLGILAASVTLAQDMAPFGTDKDAAYADKVWQAMTDQNLAGDGAIRSFPYDGLEPHGLMLETFYTKATIDGHEGDLVIKRNYGPEGVSADQVLMAPGDHLGAITVMFKREDGYDPDNQNWFWAKYLPDGSLDKNPKDMRLAGRVAKGMDAGCIACHTAAPGDDYLYTTDHIAK
ncbi:cytochrome P460 family protein [Sediminimonas qiaohouensis]|uniref:cytochrome P460 family protein n=1 Tax=Sediminimonas qiaohouensis TaxID=552061 RepID=UPI0004192815|nr:cytochrome P460 family protein [Sediminimonas qiaohouensis]